LNKVVEIEKIVYGGKGLARTDEGIIFVPYVLPKEKVEIKIIDRKKNLIFAKPLQIIEKNPNRIEPECQYFGICGGCQFQHTSYDYQIELKQDILKETFQRIGKIQDVKISQTIPSPSQFFYRNKTQLKVDKKNVGYFMEESHHVVDINRCILLKEDIANAPENLKKLIKKLEKKPEEIHLFSNLRNEIVMKLIYKNPPKNFPFSLNKIQEITDLNIRGFGIYKAGKFPRLRKLEGKKFLYEKVGDIKYRISIDSFFQVNIFQYENIINAVIDEIKDEGYNSAVDFYCGVGTFTIPASKYVEEIVGIEINKSAVEDAVENAQRNDIYNATFYQADSSEAIELLEEINPELVIFDPPRSGLTKEIIDSVSGLPDLKKIIYVSCDPTTLARDIKLFKERGITLEKLKMIDMFPQTYHIESIAVLAPD